MRYSRQNKILQLIRENDIDTQERLSDLLSASGFHVTQATISRDIKELQLIKTMTADGKYKYVEAGKMEQPISDRFVKIFKETIQSVASSGNIIVIKTLNGCANAAAETIDAMEIPHILGSIAGDNTVFIVATDPSHIVALMKRFNDLLQ
ncbi:MAG: arginine repressor [Clostridiales Family XIII bacterium]|jgi:transcriptional regulator of arginine metabolism|nr:arginine repressor [Clostridiales Family XIII bacterium]